MYSLKQILDEYPLSVSYLARFADLFNTGVVIGSRRALPQFLLPAICSLPSAHCAVLFALSASPFANSASRVTVNPGLGEANHELLRILARTEFIRQTADGVRLTQPIARPGDLRPRAPGFRALV